MKIILFCIVISRFKMRNDFWAEKKEVFVIEIKTTVVNFHCISIRKGGFLQQVWQRKDPLFDSQCFNIMTRLFCKPLGHFCQKSSK